MAKGISTIHDFINFITGKGQTGYHSPEEIDNAVHVASRALFDEKKKIYEQTREITTDLLPFITDPIVLTLNGSGIATIPANFKYLVAMTGDTNSYDVQEVDKGALANHVNDPICAPTAEYAICAFYKTTIQFYPTSLTNVKITYLKEPVKPVWAYTIVSNRPVYDDTNSVDIEWGEENYNDIMMKSMDYLGINLREGALTEFAQMKKQETV